VNSKITLYSKKALIEQMKVYAKEQNSSVSKIVNEFFKNLLKEREEVSKKRKKSQITDSLAGILHETQGDKKIYHNYLEEKYL